MSGERHTTFSSGINLRDEDNILRGADTALTVSNIPDRPLKITI